MKKEYESPNLFLIRFDTVEHLMVSVTNPDEKADAGSVKLPSVDIFG